MNGPADFFRNMLPYARRVSELTGVDPRLVLAQSALETGYGRSAPGQNYFGIKAPAGQGQGLLTQEFEGGRMVQRREPFRTYESPAQSFEDYANLLLRSERYQPVLEARTIEDQIRAMGASGYATDPEYANKLRSIAMGIDLNDPALIASDAMAAIGRGPDTSSMMATAETRPRMNGQPMTPGLLAQDAAATARPMPQAPGRDYGNLLDALAIGFSGMSMRPNEGLIRLAESRIQDRRATAQRNATADWLESQGMTQQAEAVRRGVLTGAEALQMARGGEATAAQRNYEFLISQGVDPETAMQLAFAGGPTVNVVGEGFPGLGKLATDYGYVTDPATGAPIIDPETGLPTAAPIPGSATARQIEEAAAKGEERGRQLELRMGTTLENLNLNIAEIEDKGIPVTGAIGAVGRLIPGTPASDFAARTAQINTRAALDEVQTMRDNSPTGGAVGQLTDSERIAIGQAATSLSESTSAEEYLRSAKKFRETMLNIAHGEGNWTLTPDGRVLLNVGGGAGVQEAPSGGRIRYDAQGNRIQ